MSRWSYFRFWLGGFLVRAGVRLELLASWYEIRREIEKARNP